MAKDNNLKDFLTDVADAIREKEGSTGLINPQEFSAKIRAIETGGGGESGGGGASAGAVNFRDYDGTILHSFSKDEFLALEALPELPTQSGLICQSWNWSLADAQEYVAEYGKLDVFATYITDDGKTRLYITIAAEGRMDVPLALQQSVSNGVVVDWGDGSATETFSETSATTLRHTYGKVGDYVITLEVLDGTLSLSGSSSYGIFADSKKVYGNMLQKVEIGNGVTSIGNYAFYNCYSLASVVIPNGVTSIGSSAFYGCYSLASVVIPQGVTSIGIEAFYNCYSLASVVIPQGVTSIGDSAFRNCYSLASVVIPQGVTSIGNYAFNYCYSLASVVIPNGVTSIGNSAFYSCTTLASVVIPNGVTSIGSAAFYGCYSLASVVIPQGVTSIGIQAFYNCYSLASVVIPNGVTSIGNSAFYGCTSLASVVIPQGVKSIGNQAFYGCTSLASVVIPNSVTSIGSSAFYGCTSLAILDLRTHTSVPTLSNTNAFTSVASDLKIVVPDGLYDTWIAATNWSSTSVSKYIVKASEFNA